MGTPTVDQVVEVMLALREKRSALKDEYEAADAKIKAKYVKGELFLKQHLLDNKLEKFTAGGATVYTSTTMKSNVADKGALYDYLRDNPQCLELLQARITNAILKEYIDDNDGELPPGVSVSQEVNLNIRRKPAAKK